MECSCDVYVEGDGYPAFYNDLTHKARKNHRCCECGRDIIAGETYNYTSGLWDGKFDVYKTCADCVSIRNEFFSNGWNFTNVMSDLIEHLYEIDGDISEDCILNLTPRAKQRVADIIQKIFQEREEDD